MSFDGKAAGKTGEDLACLLLQKKGFRILRRNFVAMNKAEVDIIAQDGEATVFVEVKAFQGDPLGEGPEANVTYAKQRRVISAARQYLAMMDREPVCRFDVVAVTLIPGAEPRLEHFLGAFTE